MLKEIWRLIKLFFTWLWNWGKPPVKDQPKISLLIPFSSGSQIRERTFQWLLKYWAHELPCAEICIGKSKGKIFCKGEALNHAARKATGKVLVILDADTYFDGEIINHCADRILEELEHHLWYVPYNKLYRLTKEITDKILDSPPQDPLRIPHPPLPDDIEYSNMDKSGYGHRYGAMITIMPREALDVLGCFDERFKGWGGEDIAILRALDTLYGLHKTTDNDVLHLWHPFIGVDYKTRVWEGQDSGGGNNHLASEYNKATRNPSLMRRLVDEGCRKLNR